ncbi:unnamed protein product [Albugo candida]|uniref:Phosphatidylserine decarboxylase n=1 Tax=Albugo candida TaxID=65357 RepID=A0A024FV09_9STRA|nr:unnamed protein product [Albugo candida]|eukprot:CCI10767.1 unnamed protein product [Albugo candida]
MWYKHQARSRRYKRNALLRSKSQFFLHEKRFSQFTDNTVGYFRQAYENGWKIPAALGFTLIGILQCYHLTRQSESDNSEHVASGLGRFSTHASIEERRMLTQRQVELLKTVPYRAISRLWGQVNDKELPVSVREPIYQTWTYLFGCNLDEMKYPLNHYHNLGEFFSRPLKRGVRSFINDSHHLASPVDAVVASFGRVVFTNEICMLEQIKGVRYRMDEFLGSRQHSIDSETSLSSKNSTKMLYRNTEMLEH